ncbi:hypothetical protein TNCV_2686361 [Trichonephila clavipes]|nr:hypothetical protein TNCV_2686361 [Trichonephila clavipes]
MFARYDLNDFARGHITGKNKERRELTFLGSLISLTVVFQIFGKYFTSQYILSVKRKVALKVRPLRKTDRSYRRKDTSELYNQEGGD